MVGLKMGRQAIKKFNMVCKTVSIADLSSSKESGYSLERDVSGYAIEEYLDSEDDDIVPKSELEKVRLLLTERDAITLVATITDLTRQRKQQREKRKQK